jgi:hypothetical protein
MTFIRQITVYKWTYKWVMSWNKMETNLSNLGTFILQWEKRVLFNIDCFGFNPTKGSHMVQFVQAAKAPNIVVIFHVVVPKCGRQQCPNKIKGALERKKIKLKQLNHKVSPTTIICRNQIMHFSSIHSSLCSLDNEGTIFMSQAWKHN